MLMPWALRYKKHKKRLAWSLYQKRIMASCAGLVATSEQERDSIKQLFPLHPIAVIPNGVEFPIDIPDRAARSGDRSANLLFMSRVHPVKNLFGLVQAWQEVCRRPPMGRWVLQIAGPDELDHTREIKAMVHSLGLVSRVEFLGPITEGEKNRVFEAADLFVLPSFSENFGVVVAEALAHGLPVVAARGTPWKGLIEQKCGWWVDPTPGALARDWLGNRAII
jgi:glycosyltransferase involved in cell wall biosynthesis